MNMDTSAKTLNTQSSLKASEVEEIIYYDFTHNEKLWSSSPTSRYTTTLGESLIATVNKRSKLYSARRVGSYDFEVDFVGDENNEVEIYDHDGDDLLAAPLPLFRRTHKIHIDSDGVMYCGCCAFESCGIFCEHQKAVSDFIYQHLNLTFDGFTKHDIALRYNAAYMHLAYKRTTPNYLNAMFHYLSKNEVKGPRLQVKILDSIAIEEPSTILPASLRLKNYDGSKITIDNEYFDNMHTLTQESTMSNVAVPDDFEAISVNPLMTLNSIFNRMLMPGVL